MWVDGSGLLAERGLATRVISSSCSSTDIDKLADRARKRMGVGCTGRTGIVDDLLGCEGVVGRPWIGVVDLLCAGMVALRDGGLGLSDLPKRMICPINASTKCSRPCIRSCALMLTTLAPISWAQRMAMLLFSAIWNLFSGSLPLGKLINVVPRRLLTPMTVSIVPG